MESSAYYVLRKQIERGLIGMAWFNRKQKGIEDVKARGTRKLLSMVKELTDICEEITTEEATTKKITRKTIRKYDKLRDKITTFIFEGDYYMTDEILGLINRVYKHILNIDKFIEDVVEEAN